MIRTTATQVMVLLSYEQRIWNSFPHQIRATTPIQPAKTDPEDDPIDAGGGAPEHVPSHSHAFEHPRSNLLDSELSESDDSDGDSSSSQDSQMSDAQSEASEWYGFSDLPDGAQDSGDGDRARSDRDNCDSGNGLSSEAEVEVDESLSVLSNMSSGVSSGSGTSCDPASPRDPSRSRRASLSNDSGSNGYPRSSKENLRANTADGWDPAALMRSLEELETMLGSMRARRNGGAANGGGSLAGQGPGRNLRSRQDSVASSSTATSHTLCGSEAGDEGDDEYEAGETGDLDAWD